MDGVLGIDVSHYEHVVDWHAVSAAGFQFAYAKATEGATVVDETFQTNWAGIREAGLLRGAYHFAHPGGDPLVQAAFFVSVVGQPTWGELPPVLDLEKDDGHSAADVIDWTLEFVAAVEKALNRQVMLYTGGLWRNTLHDPKVPQLADHPLWIARYGSQPPVLPQNWSKWDFWQFTDGTSGQTMRIPGVTIPCDVNRFRGTATELQSLVDKRPPSTSTSTSASSAAAAVTTSNSATTARAATTSSGTTTSTAAAGSSTTPGWPGRVFVHPNTPFIRGDDVLLWQQGAAKRGYTIATDGIYGPQSKSVCSAFQLHAGLDSDGIVGKRTWIATFDPALEG